MESELAFVKLWGGEPHPGMNGKNSSRTQRKDSNGFISENSLKARRGRDGKLKTLQVVEEGTAF